MTPGFAVELCRNALMAAFWISLPILLVGFAAGIVVSLVQTITSMQDSSFGSVPRLAAFLAGLLVLLPWMLSRAMAYTTALFSDLGRYAG
jgi:flagellar biosynthetic protein FliQ